MKVVIDISRLSSKALKRGEGIYAQSLCQALKELENGNQYQLKKEKGKAFDRVDICHYPYFNPFFIQIPWWQKEKRIITVHDLTPLKFPRHYPPGLRGGLKWQLQKWFLRRAPAIITDSQSSREDIISLVACSPKKVFVIPLAVDEQFKELETGNCLARPDLALREKQKIRQKYSLPDKFILYAGDLNWNKNVGGLVKAFHNVKSQSQPTLDGVETKSGILKLVLVGAAFRDSELLELKKLEKLIEELDLKNQVLKLGFVPKEDLVRLYNLASLYIQPSYYEGFGLPVLEAMSCGCPVLCSDQASLPEIGGRAVVYFNPYQQGELASKIKELLTNPARLDRLAQKGLRQARKFSWRQTAQETAKVYKEVFKK